MRKLKIAASFLHRKYLERQHVAWRINIIRSGSKEETREKGVSHGIKRALKSPTHVHQAFCLSEEIYVVAKQNLRSVICSFAMISPSRFACVKDPNFFFFYFCISFIFALSINRVCSSVNML